MKAATLIRPGSISPRTEFSGKSPSCIHETSGYFSRQGRSLRMSLDVRNRDLQSPKETSNPLRRVRSDTDLIRLPSFRSIRSPPMRLEEEDGETYLALSPAEEVELDCSGGGIGIGRKVGGGSGGKGEDEANGEKDPSIGNYYQDMLEADPLNPLLLRNYGKFLHEVEGDLEKAEEYYGRAILACPDDGDLLSLYGRLVWESQRDRKRAEGYYERAVEASPQDCYVMGSYAHFLWDAEEEDEAGRVASS